MKKAKFITIVFALITVIISCNLRGSNIGTDTNPLILEILTPSPVGAVINHINNVAKFIESESGLKTAIYAPKRSIEYIQALSQSSPKADVAILNDTGYLFANDEFGATAELITLRSDGGNKTISSYCPAIVSITLSSIDDLNGHSIAFSDEYSTAGYLVPLYTLREKGIKPSRVIFAGGYIEALRQLLNGAVDAAPIYTSCEGMNNELDTRNILTNEYPDIFTRTKIIYKARPVPNEPVVFRKNIPQKIKERVINALLRCPEDRVCRDSLYSINKVRGFKRVSGEEYNYLRAIIKSLEKDTADLIPGGWVLRIKNTYELPRTGN